MQSTCDSECTWISAMFCVQVDECHSLVPNEFNPFEADLSELGLLDNLISSVCASKSPGPSDHASFSTHSAVSVSQDRALVDASGLFHTPWIAVSSLCLFVTRACLHAVVGGGSLLSVKL